MQDRSEYRPFWIASSAYQTDWFAFAPVAPRRGWFKRLCGILNVFVAAPLRAHMAAAAEARRRRLNLDEM